MFDPGDFIDVAEEYVDAYETVLADPSNTSMRYLMGRLWPKLVTEGHKYASWVLETKAIPKGQTRSLNSAARLFTRRSTRDYWKWTEKNIRHIRFMIDALTWQDRSDVNDDIERTFQVGSFTVHNTVHADADALSKSRKLIIDAERALPRTGLPGIRRSAYGEIFLVGAIGRSNWLAWYFPDKDTINLRPVVRNVDIGAHQLIHEILHRYWHKDLSQDQKRLWMRHHRSVGSDAVAGDLPGVGEQFPFKMKLKIQVPGRTRRKSIHVQPTVAEVGRGWMKFVEDPDQKYSTVALTKMMHNQARLDSFPTEYSATTAEEHFCEAGAMKALGTLPQHHVAAFDAVFLGNKTSSRVAMSSTIGRLVRLSNAMTEAERVAKKRKKKQPQTVQPRKDQNSPDYHQAPKKRNDVARGLAERGGVGQGYHQDQHTKKDHKKKRRQWRDQGRKDWS